MRCVKAGRTDLVENLLEEHLATVDDQDDQGRTPLHHATSLAMIHLLINVCCRARLFFSCRFPCSSR